MRRVRRVFSEVSRGRISETRERAGRRTSALSWTVAWGFHRRKSGYTEGRAAGAGSAPVHRTGSRVARRRPDHPSIRGHARAGCDRRLPTPPPGGGPPLGRPAAVPGRSRNASPIDADRIRRDPASGYALAGIVPGARAMEVRDDLGACTIPTSRTDERSCREHPGGTPRRRGTGAGRTDAPKAGADPSKANPAAGPRAPTPGSAAARRRRRRPAKPSAAPGPGPSGRWNCASRCAAQGRAAQGRGTGAPARAGQPARPCVPRHAPGERMRLARVNARANRRSSAKRSAPRG